MADLNNGAA